MTKYSEAQRLDILSRHFGSGETYQQIADALGITRCAVAGVISRNREKYLGDDQ